MVAILNFSNVLLRMGTSVSKQAGGGYPSPLERKQIESQILRIARRYEPGGLPSSLREKLRGIAIKVFNHQNELSKGNTLLLNAYRDEIRKAFEKTFPSGTPDAQIKIQRYTDEILQSLQRQIEQNTWTRPLAESGDPIQKEHFNIQSAPSLRRAKAQQNATRRWRLIQSGGFLDIFKQRSEEPTSILHKRLRRRKTRKVTHHKQHSGFLSFLTRK